MPFISASDGTQLYWRDWGSGAPMLFLNSLGCGAEMWDYQMTAFADEGFRCIGFDRRGHGRSDQPARGYDFDTFADDVAALIDALELSDLTLIAHSIAGGEAVRYLTRHGRDRVARMILLAPTTPMLLKTDDNPNGALESEFEALWAQWKRDYPKWIADNVAPFFIPETSPAMMRWGAGLLQTPVPIALACARAMVEEDFRAEMRGIDVPTLIVHGDRDRSAPVELTGKPSAELIPGCRLLVYEGAPHGLMFTHMDQLHADILRFVRETRSATRLAEASSRVHDGPGRPRWMRLAREFPSFGTTRFAHPLVDEGRRLPLQTTARRRALGHGRRWDIRRRRAT
jgi:non-heme chloroperoxidase